MGKYAWDWYVCSTVQACMAAHSLLYRSAYFYCFLDREHIDEEPDEIDGDLQEAIASSLRERNRYVQALTIIYRVT